MHNSGDGQTRIPEAYGIWRSPYSSHEEDAATLINHSQDGTSQQHNAKGHPINPAKEQLSASLRQAQNEVLAVMAYLRERMMPRTLISICIDDIDMVSSHVAFAELGWCKTTLMIHLQALYGKLHMRRRLFRLRIC
ncbi:hypothetical protein MRB53_040160 [Persea americana]|nr:hypothetical protein MRB53_040160 [Persea americana]